MTTNSVVGDVPVEIAYSDYADYGGVKFPKRIVEKQDGFETLDVTIRDVKPKQSTTASVIPPGAAPPESHGHRNTVVHTFQFLCFLLPMCFRCGLR